MNRKACPVRVYTQNGAIEINAVCSTDNFADKLAEALELGPVLIDTVDNTKLLINPINVVMLEICEPIDYDDGAAQ